jgi:hypothetical protein
MLSDRELWERALALESRHGDQVHLFITERIGTTAFADDINGLTYWQEIAARIEQLWAAKRQ